MKKEDLINCKVRVTTEEISRKVQEKLLELGFRWVSNGTDYKPIINGFVYIWPDFDLTTEEAIGFKEIPYTDIIGEDSEDFSSWQELFQWCANKKELYININEAGLLHRFEYPYQGVPLCRPLDSYKKSLPKPKPKEVKLYAFKGKSGANPEEIKFLTHDGKSDTFWERSPDYDIVIKTENKTVILGE